MRAFAVVEIAVMLGTILQWAVIATITGLIVGSGVSLFLHGLFFSIASTASAPFWLVLAMLPAGGLLNGLLLHYGYRGQTGPLKDSMFAAVHVQRGRMPLSTLWIKPVCAIITLASGGSAGKEGPCSYIGASLAAALGAALRLNAELRQRLVACGVSAGFAAVFGTPIGGALYGVEVLAIGRIRSDFLLPAVVAGVVSWQTSLWWGMTYPMTRLAGMPPISIMLLAKTLVIGLVAGVSALAFIEAVRMATRLFTALRLRFRLWPPIVPMLGGVVLAALVLVIPTDYLGLSFGLVDRALAGEPMSYLGVVWKILLVAITLGSGFYGGIVTPQFVIGALAGNAAALALGLPAALGAAVGLIAVVAAASNTPVAAMLMGVELFAGHVDIAVLAGAAITAYVAIGHRSVYPEQRVAYSKTSWLRISPELVVATTHARLSHGLLRWWTRRNAAASRHPRKR